MERGRSRGTHHSWIMIHPQHQAEVFGRGSEDAGDLVALIDKARKGRAAVSHVGFFTPQNPPNLRLVFTTPEEGLEDATPAFEFTCLG